MNLLSDMLQGFLDIGMTQAQFILHYNTDHKKKK